MYIYKYKPITSSKYKNNYTKAVTRYGGHIKWNLDDQVNFIIIEKATLEKIFNKFISWREAVLNNKIEEYREENQKK